MERGGRELETEAAAGKGAGRFGETNTGNEMESGWAEIWVKSGI